MTTANTREVATGGRHPMHITDNGDGSATLERFFDAPRELVYQLLIDPDHYAEWWGPRRMTTEVVEMDVRVGGLWVMNNIDPEGNVYEFRGEYLALDPPSTIRQTFQFMGFPDAISTETLTLTERDGGTLLTVVADYGSPEGAAGAIGSGMEHGASETYDRLEELLLARA